MYKNTTSNEKTLQIRIGPDESHGYMAFEGDLPNNTNWTLLGYAEFARETTYLNVWQDGNGGSPLSGCYVRVTPVAWFK